MSALATFFTSLLITSAGKILTALGISFITYTGLDLLQGKFIAWMLRSVRGMPADAVQIFYLSGGGVFLNLIFGAFAFLITIKTTAHLAGILKAK